MISAAEFTSPKPGHHLGWFYLRTPELMVIDSAVLQIVLPWVGLMQSTCFAAMVMFSRQHIDAVLPPLKQDFRPGDIKVFNPAEERLIA